jgi:hypothetical protein
MWAGTGRRFDLTRLASASYAGGERKEVGFENMRVGVKDCWTFKGVIKMRGRATLQK